MSTVVKETYPEIDSRMVSAFNQFGLDDLISEICYKKYPISDGWSRVKPDAILRGLKADYTKQFETYSFCINYNKDFVLLYDSNTRTIEAGMGLLHPDHGYSFAICIIIHVDETGEMTIDDKITNYRNTLELPTFMRAIDILPNNN